MSVRLRRTLLVAATVLPSSLVAQQGVIVQSVSDTRFFGALGTMAGIASKFGGGDMRAVQTTTAIAGHKLKVESGDNGSIIDADAGRFTAFDNKQRTFSTMTFADMSAAMSR